MDIHEPPARTGFLAAEGLERQLRDELAATPGLEIAEEFGRLFICNGRAEAPAAWAANTWFDLAEHHMASIGEGAKHLRAHGRNWALYDFAHHRRAALLKEKLPSVSMKPIAFPAPAPASALGSWMLAAPDRLIYAARCSSPFANGEPQFVEDRSGPPNRAYLKLWEAFTRLRLYPAKGQTCIDLGASPGGWTWVLASLGPRVIAVDKAPLAPNVAALANVESHQASAFALEPAQFGRIDWLCSDIICYPARLLKLVQRWQEEGQVRHILCTLKFQAETDHEAARAFAALPNAQLFHLHHNRHELTCYIGPGA